MAYHSALCLIKSKRLCSKHGCINLANHQTRRKALILELLSDNSREAALWFIVHRNGHHGNAWNKTEGRMSARPMAMMPTALNYCYKVVMGKYDIPTESSICFLNEFFLHRRNYQMTHSNLRAWQKPLEYIQEAVHSWSKAAILLFCTLCLSVVITVSREQTPVGHFMKKLISRKRYPSRPTVRRVKQSANATTLKHSWRYFLLNIIREWLRTNWNDHPKGHHTVTMVQITLKLKHSW